MTADLAFVPTDALVAELGRRHDGLLIVTVERKTEHMSVNAVTSTQHPIYALGMAQFACLHFSRLTMMGMTDAPKPED